MTISSLTTSTDPAPRTTNAEVIETIQTHHAEFAVQLRELTSCLLAAAKRGDCATARIALHDWYRDELMPHIVAEEHALYRAAAELDNVKLLVCGMHSEHRALVSLIADLALAPEPFETALAAASAQALFSVHLSKENDLLLPALDTAGLDLAALLNGMHEILGSTAQPSGHDGCGCGCAHGAADGHDRSAELDVRALPPGRRHEIIFGRLDGLVPGQTLLIVNDHDPKPLRYQTEALWPDEFEWTYRDTGPDLWRVAITRAH